MAKTPCNFRDLGGIKTRDGRTVKPGLLLRSGEPDTLTQDEAREFVYKYKISRVVDFRFADDEAADAFVQIGGIERVNIDVLKNAAKYVPGFKNFHQISKSETAHDYMRAIYSTMVKDPEAAAGFKAFLDILIGAENGAVLFHCFAGKDRTGLAAAILLTVLGAEKDAIFEDYLLTNELRREENAKIIETDKKNGVSQEQLEIMSGFLLVRPDYLEEAYKAAGELFGSFESYIENGLKLSSDEQAILKSKYLD